MTDIKAYEGLTANQQLNLFRNMYYNDGNATEKGIIANAINDILPKYNRQKAEIEKLQKVNEGYAELEQGCYVTGYKNIRAEAIKEFAERLKEKYKNLSDEDHWVVVGKLNDLVKEMTEEDK